MEISSILQTTTGVQPRTNVQPQIANERRGLIQAANVINASQALGSGNELVILMDRTTHKAIMRVVDRNTKEVVMQIPSDDVLRLARDIKIQGAASGSF